MVRVPLPQFLPGAYAVIEHSDQGYTLIVDDKDKSSYSLGDNMTQIVKALQGYRPDNLLLDTVDRAREFGAAQLVFAKKRVISLPPRVKHPVVDFSEFDNEDGFVATGSLPALK